MESYEPCQRIYNVEMAGKIDFLICKNLEDPWQGYWGPVWKPLSTCVSISFISPSLFSLTFLYNKLNAWMTPSHQKKS